MRVGFSYRIILPNTWRKKARSRPSPFGNDIRDLDNDQWCQLIWQKETTRHYLPPAASTQHRLWSIPARNSNLNLIKCLDLTANLQEIQRTENMLKEHCKNTTSKIHTAGNPPGQMILFLLQKNCRNKKRRGSYLFQEM